MWHLEDFDEINSKAPDQKVSRFHSICRAGGTNAQVLGSAYETMEDSDETLVCFAQIPFSLVDRTVNVVRPGITRLVDMELIPARLLIEEDGSQRLVTEEKAFEKDLSFAITQVVAKIKLWGIRKDWYKQYLNCVSHVGLKDEKLVPVEYSWFEDHRAISSKSYESDLSGRVRIEVFAAIRRILPDHLAVRCEELPNYFAMTALGRLAFSKFSAPTIRHLPQYQSDYVVSGAGRAASEYYSVFLSYGSPDTEIAEFLRGDLRELGIETWWFPDDARWGERLHHEIGGNLEKYEKLILLCSRKSLIRPGVLYELEEVLSRERRNGGASIIIPLMLDDVLFEDWWTYDTAEDGSLRRGSFSEDEIGRRKMIATKLSDSVAGDLKGLSPGSDQWLKAVSKLKLALKK